MSMPPQEAGPPAERIQVEWEHHSTGNRVRISVEGYDEIRGWCNIGSIDFPLHELPLLEQALAELRAGSKSSRGVASNIIPFPGAGTHRKAEAR